MKSIYVAILMLATQSHAAQAEAACGPKQAMMNALTTEFGEIPFATGVSLNKSVKLFGNPQTGTWSLVLITPEGVACIVAAGEGLEVATFTASNGAVFGAQPPLPPGAQRQRANYAEASAQ